MNDYLPRTLKAFVSGVTWSSSKISSLADVVIGDSDPKKKFTEFFYCNLSFSAIEIDVLNKIFPTEWATEQSRHDPIPAHKIDVLDLEFTDESVTFSFEATWDSIPISADIVDNEQLESIISWPTDLIDELWANDEAIQLIDDMEEIGIDSKALELV